MNGAKSSRGADTKMSTNLTRMPRPALFPPTGVDPKRYHLCLLGSLALGLSLGMQVTMTTFLVLGRSSNQSSAEELTEYGRSIARPEHDLTIYVAGSLFTLCATL